MLHSDRESIIIAVRVGSRLRLGFHLSANLIETLSRIPISAHGKIKPDHILWYSFHPSKHWINYMHYKSPKQGSWGERAPQNGEIPFPHRHSSAYGQTCFGPNRQNTNDTDIRPAAQGSTSGFPITRLPGICCDGEELNGRTAVDGSMKSLMNYGV